MFSLYQNIGQKTVLLALYYKDTSLATSIKGELSQTKSTILKIMGKVCYKLLPQCRKSVLMVFGQIRLGCNRW